MVQVSSGTLTGKRVDPYATFKFHLEIDGIQEASFHECSGLEVVNDIFEYQEGGLNEYTHKLPGRMKLSNVTLKRGFATSNELYKWYLEMEEGLLKGKGISRKKVTISIASTADKDETVSWTLHDAFPVKWVGPAMKADESTIAFESLEFAHHGITLG